MTEFLIFGLTYRLSYCTWVKGPPPQKKTILEKDGWYSSFTPGSSNADQWAVWSGYPKISVFDDMGMRLNDQLL